MINGYAVAFQHRYRIKQVTNLDIAAAHLCISECVSAFCGGIYYDMFLVQTNHLHLLED